MNFTRNYLIGALSIIEAMFRHNDQIGANYPDPTQ